MNQDDKVLQLIAGMCANPAFALNHDPKDLIDRARAIVDLVHCAGLVPGLPFRAFRDCQPDDGQACFVALNTPSGWRVFCGDWNEDSGNWRGGENDFSYSADFCGSVITPAMIKELYWCPASKFETKWDALSETHRPNWKLLEQRSMICIATIPHPDRPGNQEIAQFPTVGQAIALSPKVPGAKIYRADDPSPTWTYVDGQWRSGSRLKRLK